MKKDSLKSRRKRFYWDVDDVIDIKDDAEEQRMKKHLRTGQIMDVRPLGRKVMAKSESAGGTRPSWFVGAYFSDKGDQTDRYIAEGIWKNGYKDKYIDVVRSMRPGDRIAIKASYTRKHDLPFDNRGEFVSVVGIKAVGTITKNLDDGRIVRVDWAPTEPVREWYFFTNKTTVWRVLPGKWRTDGLIAFAFEHKLQDIERFHRRNQERGG